MPKSALPQAPWSLTPQVKIMLSLVNAMQCIPALLTLADSDRGSLMDSGSVVLEALSMTRYLDLLPWRLKAPVLRGLLQPS